MQGMRPRARAQSTIEDINDPVFMEKGPGLSPTGLRARVGAVHLPLGELLQTFLAAGLVIERFEEPQLDDREYPHWLALRARR